jgi:hypothetical protein
MFPNWIRRYLASDQEPTNSLDLQEFTKALILLKPGFEVILKANSFQPLNQLLNLTF